MKKRNDDPLGEFDSDEEDDFEWPLITVWI
jgi:hypothetical protein